MKRTLRTPLLLCAFALVVNTSAHAQQHQHKHADTTKAMPVEGGEMTNPNGMMSMEHMKAMMQMHGRMMADSVLHRHMMANPDLHRTMQELMGGDMDMTAMHAQMAAMSPGERLQRMQQMHARMVERMQAMPAEKRQALVHKVMQLHQKVMADPIVHARVMADSEMRQMMEHMREDGMEHKGMDHDQMEGMERSQTGAMTADEVRAAEAASRTADRFSDAIAGGDRAAVEALLLPDALVLEGGKTEPRAAYLGHHFGSDAAFLSAVTREPLTRHTTVAGDAAWVVSISRLHGTYEGRARDLDSAELLVLRRDASAPDGWRVAAVHWSSASR